MIKLLLVEDDAPIRRGIIRHMDWDVLGVDEVRSASNAEEALEMTGLFNPDIVISDIRMPGMLGTDLCREIRKTLPNVEIIFISGYSDKEYLTAAIELTAAGYVEKPIDTKELAGLIEKAIQRILQHRETSRIYLHSLLSRGEGTMSPKAGERHGRIFLINVKQGIGDVYDLAFRLQQELNGPDSTEYRAMGDLRSRDYGAILVSRPRAWSPSAEERVRMKILEMRPSDEDWFVTSGRSVDRAEDVRDSYDDAREAQRLLGYRGWNTSASWQEPVTEWHGSISQKDERELYTLIQHREAEQATELIDSWYRKLVDEHAAMNFDVRNLFHMFNHVVTLAGPEEDESRTIEEEVFPEGCYTFKELRDHVLNHIDRVLRIGAGTGENSAISQACIYIDHHIEDANLSVAEAAEAAGLTPAYLSTLFKSKMDMTPVQYIARARMGRAVALLEDPMVPLSDVAALCGYNDKKYFSKVFKKQMEMTPAEYRESLGM